MKKIYFIFLLLLLVIITCACTKQGTAQYSSNDIPIPKFSTPVTIEELRTAFYRYSVPAIVRALNKNNDENFNYIYDKVASGNEDWIYAFTTFIVPGCDASNATGAIASLAYALPNNPSAILYLDNRTIGPPLSIICTLPFIEPDYEFIVDYGERTLVALRQVNNPYLLEARNLCIKRLQKSLNDYDQLYKEGKLNYQ